MTDLLWAEKYRPKTLDEMVLEDGHRAILDKFLFDGAIPHLLLVGAVGSGKTTMAKILIKELDCTSLELNASDERGIDTMRDRVKSYLKVMPMRKWKIAFLDEADALTPDAQFCLRNMMETFVQRTRFILTANYEHKIIEALRSRCQILHFDGLPQMKIIKFVKGILDKEEVAYDNATLLDAITDYGTDVRGLVNHLQLSTIAGKLTARQTPTLYPQIVERLRANDLKGVRKLLRENNPDYTRLYTMLFDDLENLVPKGYLRHPLAGDLVEGMRWDNIVADREINFARVCQCIMWDMAK